MDATIWYVHQLIKRDNLGLTAQRTPSQNVVWIAGQAGGRASEPRRPYA